MSDKRIAIIRNAAPQDFGGGERFPVFLSEVLIQQGYNPVIISRSKKLLTFAKHQDQKTITGWWLKKQQWSGIYNILIPFYIIWQLILYFYYLLIFLRLKPSAVHIQSKDDFIAATYAARSFGIQTIWTDHADLKHVWKNVTIPFKNPIGKIVLKAAEKAHTITVVSKSEKSLIFKHLPENTAIRSKIQVIYNGVVDTADKYPQKKSKQFTFLVASRLVTDKGIGEVIDAFTKLYKEYIDIRLEIIGDGPEAKKFKQQAKGNDAVKLIGHQSNPLENMSRADVFVHPTYHEGFSVALVEAGMMSLPIIATSVGGNIEIIQNKKTGLLVPAKDTDALYNAMKELLTNTSLKENISRNARTQYVHNYQFDEIVRQNFIPLYGESQ